MTTPYIAIVNGGKKFPKGSRVIVVQEGTGRFGPYGKCLNGSGKSEFVSRKYLSEVEPTAEERTKLAQHAPAWVRINATVEHATAKAVLLHLKSGGQHWCPLSAFRRDDDGSMWIKDWIADQKGIPAYTPTPETTIQEVVQAVGPADPGSRKAEILAGLEKLLAEEGN